MGQVIGVKLDSEDQRILTEAIDLHREYLLKSGRFQEKGPDGQTLYHRCTPDEEEKLSNLNYMRARVQGGYTIRNR